MPRQLNPFVFGKPVPPTHFIGREEVINNCYNRLAGVVRTSVAVSGEHGMGKTSLLHFLMHLAQEEQWGRPYTHNIFVYLDCQAIEQFTPARFWRRVLELIREADDNLSLREQIDHLLAQPELDATHFQRLLRWLSQRQFSLILLLDSFTGIVRTSPATPTLISDFLASLRALTNLPDYALTLIIATRDPLNILCADIVRNYPGSYFYNNFAFVSLTPFSADEIDTLLKQALSEADFQFDQADLDLLAGLAGAHPALLQIAGFHLLEARRHGPLKLQTYKKIVEDFEKSGRHYFEQFWNESSPLERTLFILIILQNLSKQASLQFNMTGEEIYSLLQKHERDLIHLGERGLVQYREGTYQIFSEIFTWWIASEVAEESEAELADRHKTITEESLRRAWQIFKKLTPDLNLDRVTQTLFGRSSQGQTAADQASAPEPPASQPTEEPLLETQASLAGTRPRYQLKEVLGRGASGIVYKAFDNDLTRTVAIKLLSSSLAMSTNAERHHLLKEARAASQLQHPHIVTIYDVTEINDHICLIMEYLEGQTLANYLQEEQQLPLREVIALVGQAAAALDYAHRQGVIHRDIKPANLVITLTGGLKLTDFGIAKVTGVHSTTQQGEIKGTLVYMSPEQIINENPLDGRSDLFSLATVAFEMLSGKLPWPGSTFPLLIANITGSVPLSLVNFNVPEANLLDPIFQKALAKNPDERYQDGHDFVQALKTVVAR